MAAPDHEQLDLRMHPLHIEARRVLLDVLEVLEDQRDSLVLIGAQAIYLRVQGAGLAVTPYTTDADIGILPELLATRPQIATAMRASGFSLRDQPGHWTQVRTVDGQEVTLSVDLMVPEARAGRGRRSADIGHGRNVARRTRGIELVQHDRSVIQVQALEESDPRIVEVNTAGEASLLVAKMHKIRDRVGEGRGRANDKDALDVHRLLRGTSSERLADTIELVRGSRDTAAVAVLEEALEFLRSEFSVPAAAGCQMVARAGLLATPGIEDLAALTAELTRELLDNLDSR